MTHELHPLCTLFPRMSGSEFEALKVDIAGNGLRSPIVLHDGLILDGGNRYRACLDAGVEPRFETFVGGNVVAFVLSANLHRRHMTPGQQAAIVASAQDWRAAQPMGGDRRSDQSATLHFDSAQARANTSGASLRTQKMADKVAKASPKLARQVAHGETTLPKALRALTPVKPAVKTAAQVQVDAESDAAFGDFDPVAELEAAQDEIRTLRAEVAAMTAVDLPAEVLKLHRIAAAHERTACEKADNAARYQAELKRMSDRLVRIGKLFGERDPHKIPALVESFYRKHAQEAA